VRSPADPDETFGYLTSRMPDGSEDRLVREEPLLIVVHGQQLMTMRTPGRDADLALGFLLGEGVIASPDEVADLRVVPCDPSSRQPAEARVTLRSAPGSSARGRLSRTHEIRSSCGICGVADPDALLEELPPLLPGVPKFDAAAIPALLDALRARQPIFAATGGCHGAIVASPTGEVHGAGEDVGRHNALDKAIGEAARKGADLPRSVAVVSGRMGYDLAIKCLRVRIPILVSVSAPSSLALQLCESAGATLVGFARDRGHRVYADQGRLAR
jgi:FdhD protein